MKKDNPCGYVILGYHDPRVKILSLVPFCAIMTTKKFTLGLMIKDVAGHLGLGEHGKIVIDGSFNPIFDQVATKCSGKDALDLAEAMSQIIVPYDPVQIVCFENFADDTLNIGISLGRCLERILRDFTVAVHDVSCPIEEILGPGARLKTGSRERASDDYRDIVRELAA